MPDKVQLHIAIQIFFIIFILEKNIIGLRV